MAKHSFNFETGKWEEGEPREVLTPVSVIEPAPVVDNPTVVLRTNRGENFSGLEEELLRIAESKGPKTSGKDESNGRQWALVNSAEDTISLYDIFKFILEGDGKGDKGYGYEVRNLPEEWKKVLYTTLEPIEQNGSDWMFLSEICKNKGFRIKRNDGGRVWEIVPESEGIEALSSYRIVFHSYGGDLFNINFLNVLGNEKPVFIITSDFSVNVNSNGTYLPKIKHFIDEEGKSRVMTDTPEALSEFLLTQHEFNREVFLEKAKAYYDGTASKEEAELFEKVTNRSKNRATREEVELFYRKVSPEYNSNDTEDTGYQVYRYEGWDASFTTHGNKLSTPGDWVIIEGTSANLYFPFQVKSVTHRFSHKWSTEYEVIR